MKEKNNDETKNIKQKILKTIVIINIILVLFITTLPFAREFNLWGIAILILVNLLILIFNKQICKNKITLSISIIIYFIIMFINPVYEMEEHEHNFEPNEYEAPTEIIEEYVTYYNCYNIKLWTKK